MLKQGGIMVVYYTYAKNMHCLWRFRVWFLLFHSLENIVAREHTKFSGT